MYLTHIFFRYLKIDHFVNSIIGFNFDEEEKNEDSNPKKLDNGRLKGSSSWRTLSTNKTSPSHGKSSEEKNKKPRNNKKSGDFTRETTKKTNITVLASHGKQQNSVNKTSTIVL